jgi:hypothetical protein
MTRQSRRPHSESAAAAADPEPCISRRTTVAGLAVLPFGLCLSPPAAAQAPSGTVEINQTQIAFLVSGNLGSGRLSFQGRTYSFSIGGLGVGGFGISKLEAVGTVYGLSRIDQFPGAYGQARTGIAVGDAGGGGLWLRNTPGVSMNLRARRQGLALSMGADGIVVKLK